MLIKLIIKQQSKMMILLELVVVCMSNLVECDFHIELIIKSINILSSYVWFHRDRSQQGDCWVYSQM